MYHIQTDMFSLTLSNDAFSRILSTIVKGQNKKRTVGSDVSVIKAIERLFSTYLFSFRNRGTHR